MRIDQIIKEQFSNHIAIRRTVMGVVRDFDINLVRNSTIQELSEELWITSSRYWLSYALIAITAWVNNYPEVARNALAESGRKDAIKTTLFFCLMNLRFGRMDAAKKWFYEYFKTLDPTMLQQETAILLQSFLNGIFGKDKELEQEVISLIDEWISIINDNEQISTELLNAYETYINNLSAPVQFSYESILQFCVNSSELETSYKDVSKFELLLQFVKGLDVDAAPQDDTNYKSRIDAILMNLISNYDAEELELKKQQEYYRCIVENNGDIPQAEAQFQAMEELENTQFNIGKQMLKWAIYDDNDQTNIQVRKFGFQNTKAWFKSAVDRFDAKLQEAFPSEYKLHIDTWDGISNGNDQSEQVESIKNHFENNKFQNMFVNTPNIAAAILFIASAGLAFVTLYSLIVTALAAGFLGFRVISVKIYNYSFIIMTAFSGAFIASIGGCGIIYNADASRVFLNLMLGDDVAGFILIGTLVLGALGCIVQWRRLKGKTANGANTGHKTTVSENTAGAFAPAEKASIQNPFVREIKENWGLLLAPIVVTLFWNLWGSRLLWTLFPSMYNYDFQPQTLWHYMPSIITAILSGWEMATFIVAIKTRSKNFCTLWMLPNMIIALVYLVKMFRLLTTYGGLAWIFDLAYVIACFVPFLSWWIIRKMEKAFAAFSRNDIKAYVLCGICAFLVLRIVGSITSFIERQLIAYDGYTSIGESLLLLILNIISMAVVTRVIFRHNAYAKDHCTSVLNNNKEGE